MRKLTTKLMWATLGLFALTSSNAFGQASVTFTYATNDDLVTMGNQKSKETYDIAIKIDDQSLYGSKITGLEVPVVESDEVTDYSMWLTTELVIEKNSEGKKVNVPNICSKETVREGNVIKVTFDEPYEITGPVFAGYTMYVATADNVSGYPVVVSAEKNDNGFWFHSTRAVLSWKNQSETLGYVSALKVNLEGDFYPNAAGIYSAKGAMVQAGSPVEYSFDILNHGFEPIKSISYSYTYGGVSGDGVMEFDEPLAPIYTKPYAVSVNLPAFEEVGVNELTLSIDKVNGEENKDTNNSFSVLLNNLVTVPVHRALLEEFTGLWCGYCVRGYAAIEYMWENYSDINVPVVYHNGDPMAIDLPVNVSGFPSAMVDRVSSVDPSYGPGSMKMYETVVERSSTDAIVAVDLATKSAEEDGTVNFQAELTWIVAPDNASDISVQWVLMSDNLSDDSWAQSNYYSGNTTVADYPGMEQFIEGGSKIYGLIFNNVAMLNNGANGEYGLVNDVVVNEPMVIDFSLNYNDAISTYNNKCIVQDPNDLKVAVIVFQKDNKGGVEALNANVCKLGQVTQVSQLEGAAKTVVSTSYYGLNGQRVAEANGFVIKMTQYSDGSRKAEKVFIRK